MEWVSNKSISMICRVHIINQHRHDVDDSFIHYSEVIMDTMASQIISLTIVYSTVYSGADQGKHQSSASLAFVRGIHRWPVNSPYKLLVTRKMFPFDNVIMSLRQIDSISIQLVSEPPEGAIVFEKYLGDRWMPWHYMSFDCPALGFTSGYKPADDLWMPEPYGPACKDLTQ